MKKYYENLNEEVKEYFSILSPVFPEWLFDYINTKEMQRINKISINCGTDYSACYDIKYFYSNLDHSVGVALIIWNFTRDKKQTLAGLFHDIATPVFKHCIDFLNGDFEKQESTEQRTTDFIKNSKEITDFLKRDNIKLEEVNNYQDYSIADNETPRLSADRFEYTFSSGLVFFRIWELEKIKQIYENIIVLENENGEKELGFKDKLICEEYIHIISKIWPEWVSDKDRTVMKFLADICKIMNEEGYLSIDDLYTLSEDEVIDKILNCENKYIANNFKTFMKEANKVYSSENEVFGKYCVNVKSKTRYVNPLVQTEKGNKKISAISIQALKEINSYLSLELGKYTYFDFDFDFDLKIANKKIIVFPNETPNLNLVKQLILDGHIIIPNRCKTLKDLETLIYKHKKK